MNARKIAITFSIAIALFVVGIISWSFIGVPGQKAAGPPITMSEQPDVDVGIDPEFGESTNIITGTDEGRITGIDPNDSERKSYVLHYTELDPQPGGRMSVTQPKAWVYLASGGIAVIRAEKANLLRQLGGQPESGRLVGGVVIRFFDELEAQQITPGEDERAGEDPPTPMVTFATETIDFDLIVGEFSTPDRVLITSETTELRVIGMRAVFDEPNQSLAYLKTNSSGYLRYTPIRSDSKSGPKKRARAPGNKASGNPAQPKPAPKHDYYHAVFAEDVRVVMDGRQIAADALELWSHLIDGSLPPDAITTPVRTADANNPQKTEQTAPSSEEPANENNASSVFLTWTGPLVIRPSIERPAELTQDDLALRFTSPKNGIVALDDETTGARVRCAGLDYFLTSGNLSLTGPGDRGVELTLPDAAEIVTSRFDLNLLSGIGAFVGRSQMRALGAAAAPAAPDPYADAFIRQISWSDHCDLIFTTRDGAIDLAATPILQELIFHDDVIAIDGGSQLTGESIRVLFGKSLDQRATISRVIAEGDASADAGDDGRVFAERIDVQFDPDHPSGIVTPVLVSAQGAVKADRQGIRLNAELVEASLSRDDTNRVRLDHFAAEHAVRVIRPDGLETVTDSLRLDANARILELVGEPAVVHYRGGSLTAGSMRFEEENRRLTVFGQGVINHSERRETGFGYERMQIEWNGSMTYEDETGVAVFIGDCTATAQPDEHAQDVARGERITINLTPGAILGDPDNDSQPPVEFILATIESAKSFLGEGNTAQIESRRYAIDETTESGVRLERLTYLDGDTIIANARADTLTVPGAGRMLLEDRRPDDAGNAMRGTTLFEWDGRFHLERDAGHARMTELVRVRQRTPSANRVTELECEVLDAWTTSSKDSSAQTVLLAVEARDAVYASQGDRQLIADRLRYDAVAGLVEALAAPGNTVTMFNDSVSAPLTGSVLRWDLTSDEIEWLDAGETTLPR